MRVLACLDRTPAQPAGVRWPSVSGPDGARWHGRPPASLVWEPKYLSTAGLRGPRPLVSTGGRAERFEREERVKVDADRRRRREVVDKHPVVGRAETAFTPKATPKAQVAPEPRHIGSWGTGAVGERLVGEILDGIDGVESDCRRCRGCLV